MTFLPDVPTLAAYSLACFVLFITPGPDMSLFLARTLEGGRMQGIASLLGANAGSIVHTLLAALGLSAVLAASPRAFFALKVVGALYLLWLAVDAVRNGSALNVQTGSAPPRRFFATFLTGIGVNLTNPKVVLFFVTFLPQFVEASDPHAGAKLVFLGLYFVVMTTPLCIALIVGAEQVIASLRQRPAVLRMIDYTFATIFAGFAARVLWEALA